MFLIEAPFVSEFLKQTLEEFNISVIKTVYAEQALQGYSVNFISELEAVQAYESDKQLHFYTNSENALDWILQNFPYSDLARKVASLKDKVRFRDVLVELHPKYFYEGCQSSELQMLEPDSLPFPVILKPSVGFFSLGVQKIDDQDKWLEALTDLDTMIKSYGGLYPSGVLDNSVFIIEAVIPGDEFAVDCYFDEQGQVVILNMMKHLFASGDDVNDRVYVTSPSIMTQYLEPIQNYLNKLGSLFALKNFQAHVEIRINDGDLAAIEINPLRFGGWCSTADLAQYAWGMNLYEALIGGFRPDWNELITRDPEHVYALVVLNNSTGVPGSEITNFDYDALVRTVQEPLELRKTDFRKFPLFGFLMCRVPAGDLSELEGLLHSDLREFILSHHSG